MNLSADEVRALKLSDFFAKEFMIETCERANLELAHAAWGRIFRLVKLRLCPMIEDFDTMTVGQLIDDIEKNQINLLDFFDIGEMTCDFFYDYLEIFGLKRRT